MSWTRRRLLTLGCAAAGISAAGGWPRSIRARALSRTRPSSVDPTAKRIALVNLHTGEELETEFFRGDTYVDESLAAIQVLLRDFRNNERHVIDPRLMDYLYDVARHCGVDPVFRVISGYRSRETNERLREQGSGVARHSLHIEGRAIDVRLAGVNCAGFADRAFSLARGGVGYYRKSDFVHLDTGAFRTWKG